MGRITGIFLLVFCLAACGRQAEKNAAPAATPPNIILIFTDDQGYQDVGAFYSPDIKTPFLDQLAREGVQLTSFYAAQAVCSASRAGILTGCYPNRIGIHNALMPHSKTGLSHSETTIAEMLRSRAYKSGIFGKWHLGDHPDFMPTKHGFDEFFGILYSNDMWPLHPQQGPVFHFGPLLLYENEKVIDTLTDQSNLTRDITERSVDFIRRNRDSPFFLYIPHPQPHVPLFASEAFRGKSERGLYGDVIMEIDWSVGQIMAALKEYGLEEDTVVIFTSDNGPWLAYGNHAGSALPYREGKGTAWEGGHRVPFIMRYPGRLNGGRMIDAPVMAIDLLPTIAALTDSPLPENMIDGKDIWPLLSGATSEGPQEAYFFYYKVNELHGVRYGKWKMYFPHNYRTMNGQMPGKDGIPGEYRYVDMEKIELYDVVSDPWEAYNVAQENPDIVRYIGELARTMRARLGDSLTGVQGSENRPAGTAVW